MATMNPFDLLGDDDNDDPSQLIAKKALAPTTAPPQQQQPKQPAKQQQQQQQQQPKLPSKPVPPAQAVRESKSEGRGGGRGGGRGFGRGGRGGGGFNRDRSNNENSFGNNGVSAGYGAPEEGDAEKTSERRSAYGGPRGGGGGGGGGFRGRRGGFNNGESGDGGERPRRIYERRSGTGRGNELKREGSGRGNWGTPTDELPQDSEQQENPIDKNLNVEKQPVEEDAADASKENPVTESEEKEPEDKEMTLDEYQKILEEKRKALLATKAEERKVDVKEFESMMQLSSKKGNDDVFIKLGSDKDKKKEIDKDDRAKKSVSINEFLKPAEGERYYSPGGRGRGRGRGSRGGYIGGNTNAAAPSIEDPGEFPTLGK